MVVVTKGIEAVTMTVGELRDVLLVLPETMKLTDSLGDPIHLTVYRDAETGDEFAEIG